jgi:hypothetical protein
VIGMLSTGQFSARAVGVWLISEVARFLCISRRLAPALSWIPCSIRLPRSPALGSTSMSVER